MVHHHCALIHRGSPIDFFDDLHNETRRRSVRQAYRRVAAGLRKEVLYPVESSGMSF